MEYLLQELATLSMADRLSVIEQVISTPNNDEYLKSIVLHLKDQKRDAGTL